MDKEAASRLAGAFNTIQLRQGETVAVEGGTVDRCFMVEFGTVEVSPPPRLRWGGVTFRSFGTSRSESFGLRCDYLP